jgi:hypothetical protein
MAPMQMHSLPLSLIAVAGLLTVPATAEDSGNCPKTIPSDDLLAAPFPSSNRWYGSETLAVMLPMEGMWRGLGSRYRFRDKLFLWSSGFKPGLESNLKVSARRLDGTGAEGVISPPTNAHAPDLGGWTMLVMVEFPSPGCWEITGEYLGQTLSFVVEARADEPESKGAI